MFKKIFFVLFTFSLHSLEQSYPSNWRPEQVIEANQKLIEKNDQEINRIKNQTVKRIKSLITAIQKLEELKAKKNPEDRLNIQLLSVVYNLNKALKFIKEHQFQKAIDTLNVKTDKININIKKQLDEIINGVISINNICSNWLSDVAELPDDIASVINEYALPHRELILEGHERVVSSVSWSQDGKYVASGSVDGTIRVWNIETGQEIRRLESHESCVSSISWLPCDKYIQSLWSYFESHESCWVKSVSWSLCGKYIASGSDDETVRIWDFKTGQNIKTLKGHESWVRSVSWSPNGKQIASGSDDKTIRIWDAETGQEIKILRGHGMSVNSVAWSPCGKYLVSVSEKGKVIVWDVITGQKSKILPGYERLVNSAAWSRDGKYIASGYYDGTVRIWDVMASQEIKKLQGHKNGVNSVAWSPDGKQIASGSLDKTVRISDFETGQEIRKLKGHKDGVNSVSWSRDGKYIASGSDDGTIRIWGRPFYV